MIINCKGSVLKQVLKGTQHDGGMTESQALDVAAKLKSFDFGRVYISPFLRCGDC